MRTNTTVSVYSSLTDPLAFLGTFEVWADGPTSAKAAARSLAAGTPGGRVAYFSMADWPIAADASGWVSRAA